MAEKTRAQGQGKEKQKAGKQDAKDAAAPPSPSTPTSGAAASPSSSSSTPLLLIFMFALAAIGAAVAWQAFVSSSTPEVRLSPRVVREDGGVEHPTVDEHMQIWDPVAVNHTRRLRLDNSDRVYEMRTVAMDPPIFTIEDFLSPEECDKIIELAGEVGLFKSDHTYLDGSNLNERHKDTKGLTPEEANKLFRYSDQTWLAPSNDKMLKKLLDRARTLAMLPVDASTESLQVVKYGVEGHYESHYDSETDDKGPCCIDPVARSFSTGVSALSRPLAERCRLCRFMTILYYLVDTTEGGGTIFPLADMTTTEYMMWKARPFYRQTQSCAPGKVVPAKRGKAVMWYNHQWDRGYLGPLNPRSLHGGCNVKQGEKWIANHWISYLPHPDKPRLPASKHT